MFTHMTSNVSIFLTSSPPSFYLVKVLELNFHYSNLSSSQYRRLYNPDGGGGGGRESRRYQYIEPHQGEWQLPNLCNQSSSLQFISFGIHYFTELWTVSACQSAGIFALQSPDSQRISLFIQNTRPSKSRTANANIALKGYWARYRAA